jgi:hypothetical protein
VKHVPLTRGYVALVDDADYERVMQFKWSALVQRDGRLVYAKRDGPRPERKSIRLHRFILDAPDKVQVDHRDGDGLNCQRNNLRLATRRENSRNVRKHSDNPARFKGVYWDKHRNKWYARIYVDGVQKSLGYFQTEELAAEAYDAAAARFFGSFAKTNAELCA